MPFVEIEPAKPTKKGTGVKLSNRSRGGLCVTVSDGALAALGVTAADKSVRLRVLHDADPAAPRLRIEKSKNGPFALVDSPNGKGAFKMTKLGSQPVIASTVFDPRWCTWEDNGAGGIDIDLPRAAVMHAQPRQAQAAPTFVPNGKPIVDGRGNPTGKSVSLPPVGRGAGLRPGLP